MESTKAKITSLLAVAFLLLSTSISTATMTSTNYEIRLDSFSQGGDESSSSANYEIRDTIGNVGLEDSSSTTYELDSGYREGIFDEVVTFELHIMDRSTQVATSGKAGLVFTVTSTAGYSEGDRVVVVQDEGASQSQSTGEIVSLTASTITLDELRNTPLTIDGVDDYIYNMTGTSANLGTLNESMISTAIIGWSVSHDVDDEYGVYVYEDEDLSTGDDLDSITDVADGAVTAGSVEYGARADDMTLSGSTFDTEDTAITTTPQLVGSRADWDMMSMNHILLKASTDANQRESTYSHNLYFYYVGDF